MAMRNTSRLLLLVLLIASLPACQPKSVYVPPPDWKYADLRALDPADDIPASQDLIAMYIRRVGEDVEIRLDLLDFSTPLDCDLTFKIDTSPRGNTVYIKIPASSEITAQDVYGQSIPGLQPRVTRDTFLDTLVVSLNRSRLTHSGLPFEVQVTTAVAASTTIRDQIGPVHSDASPPQQAEVLFAFWDTFPAATPAQALRMWDGAHSGPGRSRYGLHYLLSAVKAYGVPVFLLDLKTPTILSILDFMGVLPEIQNLVDLQLATLPDVIQYNIPSSAFSSIPKSYQFDLPDSPFLYTTVIPEPQSEDHRVLFISSDTLGLPSLSINPYRWQDHRIIPIPDENTESSPNIPTPAGPSLAMRSALIQSALDPQASFILLGGGLANTSWGDPACVPPTLYYLSAHPWIRFLTADDLLTIPPRAAITPDAVIVPQNSRAVLQILPALQDAPQGPITDLAWQTYLSLLTPASTELTELRAGYFGIVGHLLVAAHWSVRPGYLSDCTTDIDWDEQAECILASPDFFATFEITGGYAVAAFVRRMGGVHQIIAPYAQFVVGLGDPSTWDPSRGINGDPALVPGGFFDNAEPWMPQVQPGQITFTSADNALIKTFRLTETGLRVDYESASPITVQISLGIDPWQRFSFGWGKAYREAASSGSWQWALASGPQVNITSSGTINARAFTATRPYLSSPEDPNFDYPPGHFIPLPLALVEISGQDDFFIEMDVR